MGVMAMSKGNWSVWRAVFASASVVATLAGCVSAEFQPITLKPLDTYRLRQERQGVLVIADPYFTKVKLEKAFPAVVQCVWGSDSIYPVHLVVHTQGRKEISVTAITIRLVWPEHEGIPPSNAETVYERVKGEEVGYMPPQGGIIGGAMTGFIQGAIEDANRAKSFQLTARELKDGLLSRGDTLSGFLYFLRPKDVDEITEGRLQVKIFDTAAKEELNFEVPIPPQYFRLRKEERELWEIRKAVEEATGG